MAVSAVLEKSTLRTEEEEKLTRAAEEHNRRSLESYRTLLAESRPASVEEMPRTESAPYEETPASSYAQAAADYRAVEMPAGRTALFENLEYRDGEVVSTVEVPQAPSAPAEENEDVMPTRRTLETLHRDVSELTVPEDAVMQSTEAHTGFWSSLSTRAKVAIVVVAAAVVLALVLIVVNTSILGGLDLSLAARQAEVTRLTETSNALRSQIAELVSPENVDRWARDVMGMIRQ